MSNRRPIAGEMVRCSFQYRNADTGTGLEGVTEPSFQYKPPATPEQPDPAPLTLAPIPTPTNPKTGATEPGWFFVDVPSTIEGTYRCMATCVGPSPTIIPGSFVVAPRPF